MSVLLKYPKCVLSAAILLAGLVMGVVKRNDLFGDYLLWLGGSWILIRLTLLLGLVALGVFLWKGRIGKFLSYSLAIGCSSIVSIQIFSETGIWINRWKVDAVESYVARAVPVLDRIKQNATLPQRSMIRLSSYSSSAAPSCADHRKADAVVSG